jgi:hypothetical protein
MNIVFLSTFYQLTYDRLEGADGIDARGEEEHILGSLGQVIHYGKELTE